MGAIFFPTKLVGVAISSFAKKWIKCFTFFTPIANRDLSITFDYAYGWDMDVSVGYRDINDVEHTLWSAYDSWGHAALGTQTVSLPAEAMDITVSIGQRSGNVIPDSTRYTIEVEVL